MSNTWQVQEAKARFSEMLETTITDGPQIVTKRGVEAAVLVPIDQWRKLEQSTKTHPQGPAAWPPRPALNLSLVPPTTGLHPPSRPAHFLAASIDVPPRHERRFRIPQASTTHCRRPVVGSHSGGTTLSLGGHDRRNTEPELRSPGRMNPAQGRSI